MKTTAKQTGGGPALLKTNYVIGVVVFVVAILLLAQRRLGYNMANLALIDGILTDDAEQLSAARLQFEQLGDAQKGERTPDWLAYLYFEQGAFDKALEQFQLATEDGSAHPIYRENTSEYWFFMGMRAANAADWPESIRAYRYALALHPRVWDKQLYVQYYAALLNSEDAQVRLAAQKVLAGDAISAETATPLPLSPTHCSTISSIQYDANAVALGPIVPISMVKTDGSKTEAFVVNLIPNAGFSWGTQADSAVGFEKTIYTQDDLPTTHSLVETSTPYATDTSVATLINTEQANWASYQSFAVEVDSQSVYFVGGWVSDQSNWQTSAIGLGWYGRDAETSDPYQFLPQAVTHDWQFVADIVTIPSVDSVDFVMTKQNAEAASVSSFDDLFLIRLDAETCTLADTIQLIAQ